MVIIKEKDKIYAEFEEWFYLGSDIRGEIEHPLTLQVFFDYYPTEPEINFPETIEIYQAKIKELKDSYFVNTLLERFMEKYRLVWEDQILEQIHENEKDEKEAYKEEYADYLNSLKEDEELDEEELERQRADDMDSLNEEEFFEE